MDSNQPRMWSPERAQGAVKAAFFTHELASKGTKAAARLKFTDLKRIVTETQSPISDRTLSKALAELLTRKQLTRRRQGKYSWYTLTISRAEKVLALSKVDAASVERAGKAGGLGDSLFGWGVYGVPEIVPRPFRVRLRREAIAHQQRLHLILEDMLEDCAKSVLKPAKRRVASEVFRRGERALWKVFEVNVQGALVASRGTRHWQVMEGTYPGSMKALQQAVGVDPTANTSLEDRLARFFAWLAEKPVDEIRAVLDEGFGKLRRQIEPLKPLLEGLTPSELARAGKRLATTLGMAYNLTSVVHA